MWGREWGGGVGGACLSGQVSGSEPTCPLLVLQVPNVKWEDIGGLAEAKRAILDTVELPLKHR